MLTPARRLSLVVVLGVLGLGATRAEDDFLPPKMALKPTAEIVNGELTIDYQIAPGYYLYRDRLGFESATPDVSVGPPSLPVGEDHEDDYFGKQVIYRGNISIGADLRFDTFLREQFRGLETSYGSTLS